MAPGLKTTSQLSLTIFVIFFSIAYGARADLLEWHQTDPSNRGLIANFEGKKIYFESRSQELDSTCTLNMVLIRTNDDPIAQSFVVNQNNSGDRHNYSMQTTASYNELVLPSVIQVLYYNVDAPLLHNSEDFSVHGNELTITWEFFPRLGPHTITTDTWSWNDNRFVHKSKKVVTPYLDGISHIKKTGQTRFCRCPS
jgi:hypothetical protein